MSALANHTFAKMNGIGNEIVVIDLRDSQAAVTPEEARAVASPAGVHYDQRCGWWGCRCAWVTTPTPAAPSSTWR